MNGQDNQQPQGPRNSHYSALVVFQYVVSRAPWLDRTIPYLDVASVERHSTLHAGIIMLSKIEFKPE